MIKYVRAATGSEDKAEFVKELGELLKKHSRSFANVKFEYIQPTEKDPIEIKTTDYKRYEATDGEFVRVYVKDDILYDVNVGASSVWGIYLDLARVLRKDF